jgi:hypothetical protein
MTGFIRGLFGGKGKQRQAPAPEEKGAFYLSSDDAKSYGNIEYMRSAKTVKRTFARKKGITEELESVKQVSALGSVRLNEYGVPVSGTSAEVITEARIESAPKVQRRQSDSNMDMFRNMAKDMKK